MIHSWIGLRSCGRVVLGLLHERMAVEARVCIFGIFWHMLLFLRQARIDWITYYKSIGCSVMVLNYRGYGRSTGKYWEMDFTTNCILDIATLSWNWCLELPWRRQAWTSHINDVFVDGRYTQPNKPLKRCWAGRAVAQERDGTMNCTVVDEWICTVVINTTSYWTPVFTLRVLVGSLFTGRVLEEW